MIEKINNFYVSGTDIVRSDLFCEYAEKIAKSFARVSPDSRNPKKIIRNGVTSTQLRRLFDEVKRYDRMLSENDSKYWKEEYPYIKMIKSKVHYVATRAKKKANRETQECYDNLINFISEGIDLIKKQKDYHIFTALFEAVYGFYYENRPDVNN